MLKFPPRRILAAVDPSAASLHAWEAAKEIAKRFDASLEAVWCVQQAVTAPTGLHNLSPRPGFRAESLKRLKARLGPGARLHAVNGDPVFALRRLARDLRVDLLVMGTHHRPGIVRWIQGSTAEAVVHDAPCPVLVVPRAWRAPRWILAPVHAAAYARRGLLSAAVLARAYKSRLALLEVVEEGAKTSSAAKRISVQAATLPPALYSAVRPSLEVRVGYPVKEILRAERGRDLLVLVAHRKSLLGHMVLGATVERVLRHSRIPILAIPSR
ncbi:MAG: universal stress protein [Elusimicrobiota bacterium]|nr:universal stress protein [Elusimicrobiota bacterium]